MSKRRWTGSPRSCTNGLRPDARARGAGLPQAPDCDPGRAEEGRGSRRKPRASLLSPRGYRMHTSACARFALHVPYRLSSRKRGSPGARCVAPAFLFVAPAKAGAHLRASRPAPAVQTERCCRRPPRNGWLCAPLRSGMGPRLRGGDERGQRSAQPDRRAHRMTADMRCVLTVAGKPHGSCRRKIRATTAGTRSRTRRCFNPADSVSIFGRSAAPARFSVGTTAPVRSSPASIIFSYKLRPASDGSFRAVSRAISRRLLTIARRVSCGFLS